MARAFKDGAGASYDGTSNQFVTVPFGSVMIDAKNPGSGQASNGGYFEMYNFGGTAADQAVGKYFPWLQGKSGVEAYKAMADNSVAGIMRDCAECHVGGGMNEYVIDSAKATSGTYSPSFRTSLRDFNFNGLVTSFNALIDVFNPDPAKRSEVVVQNYGETGVLEMDCLICHLKDYSWTARKEAVRNGEYDASRAAGAGLVNGIKNGTTVFYNFTSVKTNAGGELFVDLSAKLNATPDSKNCASCHQTQYNVDWKKRGEQWLPGSDVHMPIGCMGCHERNDKTGLVVGTSGLNNNQLGLCDPAKGGSSAFDALWNKLDSVNFKNCAGCHEPKSTPNFATYGAPNSITSHSAVGLNAKIAYDKDGNTVSHIDLIDCTACHIKKTFDGGAFVDGTGADAEGRVALHDQPQVARDMTNGNALYWDNGKLFAANLLTSFFLRDVNGMDDANNGLDANNDGRNAGMDALLQTQVNSINIAKNLKAVTAEKNADGSWVNESELLAHFSALKGDGKGLASAGNLATLDGGIKQLLGLSDPANDKKLLPKVSFLMVPFKATHNIASIAVRAWGKNGCGDCHGADKGFYNGAYPIKGNMDGMDDGGVNYKFRFKSNQVTAFTKVNGLSDVTDSHPNVVTKKGDRTVPIPMLTKFDNPFTSDAAAVGNQTLRNIDRSEVIYEPTFQARDTTWYAALNGTAPPLACSGPTSPFYCATPSGVAGEEAKGLATSTKGWLVKIEVRPAGDADPAHITFRTAQLGKDNAASMAEVLAALPGGFKTNTDFTVTESGGALRFVAATGKEIRVSPQTDVAPLGLKGNLWKDDKIVRGANSYATRAQYLGYLNSLGSVDPKTFGIGLDPKAVITTPLVDDDATQIGVQWKTGTARDINAAFAQPNADKTADLGKVSYAWTTNDPDAVIGSNPASATGALIKFTSTGIKTVNLTVTDEEGKVSSASVTVTAIAPPVTIAWTSLTKTAAFSNLPAGTTQAKIYWGDGAQNTKTGIVAANGFSLTHTYTTATAKIIQILCYSSTGAALGNMQATITP